ncbi:ABC transporter substrate-binding protein [Pigmentiphaga sp. NML080357]|uniref:Bug family tripartite tricarboxylate transporter substrate binding protein n=1 Tax=Pigmentiphaga sp. NML080357 TaxID=2008675 RepID=UPI000B41789C|nr:tripartite tricarboxylate transporter substrate binding protein [Pigmentiphaga sp. NML080357]OVZ60651.1 ABC transporter substrate-binding protein [Pigmentiphaga sp. NML080357]
MGPTRILVAACATLATAAAAAQPEAFPSRPVRIVVPFAPGGAVDVMTRQLARVISEQQGYTVVVENKPGASGLIASESVAKSPADGYTLLMATSNTHGVNSALFKQLPYDPIKDFAPVAMAADNVVVLLAHRSFPAATLQEAVAAIRKSPGKYSYASPGAGTVHHLAMELFKTAAKLDVVHVGYKGAGPAMADLAAGHVPLMMGGIAPAAPFIKTGAVRVLAVANPEPFAALPGIPLFKDVARDVSVTSWMGLTAPAGTPAPVVDKLNADVRQALQKAGFADTMADLGMVPRPMSPAEMGRIIAADMPKWKRAVQISGATAE